MASGAAKRADLPHQTVLIIDHRRLLRRLLASYLRSCGYAVFEVEALSEALDMLRQFYNVVDVVLCNSASASRLRRVQHSLRPGIEIIAIDDPKRAADGAKHVCSEGPHPHHHHQQLEKQIREVLAGRES